MAELKLVLFDMDGTLVDSFAHINRGMERAFHSQNLEAPDGREVRSIIGLSLPQAMAKLRPGLEEVQIMALVEAYRQSFADIGSEPQGKDRASPLFDGANEVLQQLHAQANMLLGIATGKSRRGLTQVLAQHGLDKIFVTTQVADDHPSKPHPSMVFEALAETGVTPDNAVIIGDTTYDLDMGRAAGIKSIAVTWGYHDRDELTSRADRVVEIFSDIPGAVSDLIGAGDE